MSVRAVAGMVTTAALLIASSAGQAAAGPAPWQRSGQHVDATPAMRVVVPCSGGRGQIALRSARTSHGGTLMHVHVSRATGKRWSGATYTDGDYPPDWQRFAVRHHGFRDSALHPHSWGERATGYYSSYKVPETLCIADAVEDHNRVAAGADYLGIRTQPHRKSMVLFFSVGRVSTWRVRIRVERRGRSDLVVRRKVTTDQYANAVATFTQLRDLSRLTHVAVHASRVDNPNNVLWMKLRRDY